MAFKAVRISQKKLRAAVGPRRSIAMIARKSGIPSGTISNWLASPGESVGIDPEYFEKLVVALEVTPEAIEANGQDDHDDATRTLDAVADLILKGHLTTGDVIEVAKKAAASAGKSARAKMNEKGKPK